jgi:rhodanese-related sulfurtransferase
MNSPTIKTITCQVLHELGSRQPIELIDVRTPEEFRDVHAAGARNVPLDSQELFDMLQQPGGETDRSLYFICEVGGRSGSACAAFMAAGHLNVVNVEGGTQVWIEAGLPVESGS